MSNILKIYLLAYDMFPYVYDGRFHIWHNGCLCYFDWIADMTLDFKVRSDVLKLSLYGSKCKLL